MRLLLGVYIYIYFFFWFNLFVIVLTCSYLIIFLLFFNSEEIKYIYDMSFMDCLLFLVLKKQIFHLIASADFHSWCVAFSLSSPHDPYYGSLMS